MLRKIILDLKNTTYAYNSVLGPQMAQKNAYFAVCVGAYL